PQPLPHLMRLPVEAVVEQVEPAQVRPAAAPVVGVRGRGPLRRVAEAVPARVADRVRRAAGDVGVGRQRHVGEIPWRGHASLPRRNLRGEFIFSSATFSLLPVTRRGYTPVVFSPRLPLSGKVNRHPRRDRALTPWKERGHASSFAIIPAGPAAVVPPPRRGGPGRRSAPRRP